jgi:hypothetical protein
MVPATIFALAALLPVALGPLPAKGRSITAVICSGNGGSLLIEIPIDEDTPAQPPCSAKGCHAGSCRKRFDLAQ